jgi:hypothetical protein
MARTGASAYTKVYVFSPQVHYQLTVAVVTIQMSEPNASRLGLGQIDLSASIASTDARAGKLTEHGIAFNYRKRRLRFANHLGAKAA